MLNHIYFDLISNITNVKHISAKQNILFHHILKKKVKHPNKQIN